MNWFHRLFFYSQLFFGAKVLYPTIKVPLLFFLNLCCTPKETIMHMTNTEDEITMSDIGMKFNNGNEEITALTSVSLHVKKGEFISLVGPSGCGKTTLLRIIADLLTPTSGTINIGGETPSEARLKGRYGMVFQSPVLYEWRTVLKNVELPLEIMGIPQEKRKERAEEMLEMVGLKDFGKSYPGQLSGGMQQRVGIARALVIRPEILLMDEPFSALDEFTRERLHEDLLNIWRRTNKTIVFVTHNISESVFLSDKICVLSPHPGRLSAVLDVDFERPRQMAIKNTPSYSAKVVEVRSSFEGV